MSPHVERLFALTGLENERLYDLEASIKAMWRAMGAHEPVGDAGPLFAGLPIASTGTRSRGCSARSRSCSVRLCSTCSSFWPTDSACESLHLEIPSRRSALPDALLRANSRGTHAPGRNDDLPAWEPWSVEPGANKFLILDSDRDGGLEFGTDALDQRKVLARAEKDPRLQGDEERCQVFRNFVQWSEALSAEGYEEVLNGACRAHPIGTRTPFPSLSYEYDRGPGPSASDSTG
jgi:hypothetical protein